MAAHSETLFKPSDALDLKNIRSTLERMEDSIIFNLIERSQFLLNDIIYREDYDKLPDNQLHLLKCAGSNGCYADWYLYKSEELDAMLGRYTYPTEYPFFGPLPSVTLGSDGGVYKPAAPILAAVPLNAIINDKLLQHYREKMLPKICKSGDDGNHGSSANVDSTCLRTIATRIYFGLFVAESKFRSDPEKATELIKAQDRDGLMNFITKIDVEVRNLERVFHKAKQFAETIELEPTSDHQPKYKLDPEFVKTLFSKFLMPLTKEVEVSYLLGRLEGDPSIEGWQESKKRDSRKRMRLCA